MSYTKQNFEDGQVLNAEHLNKMENGIADVSKIVVSGGGDTLNWTAIAESELDASLMAAEGLYRVSDAVVTLSDCANGGRLSIPANDYEFEFTGEECVEPSPGVSIIADSFLSAYVDNAVLEFDGETIVFPEAGLYCFFDFAFYDFSLTINGYTGFGTDKIDSKYLPEHLQFGYKDTVVLPEASYVFDGDATESFELAEPIKADSPVTVKWNGSVYNCKALYAAEIGGVLFGNLSILTGVDTGEPFFAVSIGTNLALTPADQQECEAIVEVAVGVPVKLADQFYDRVMPIYLDASDDNKTYIYSDLALTHKITVGELYEICGNYPIVLRIVALGVAQHGCAYPTLIEYDTNNWYKITSAFGTHYTAEYTPK